MHIGGKKSFFFSVPYQKELKRNLQISIFFRIFAVANDYEQERTGNIGFADGYRAGSETPNPYAVRL